MSTSRLADYAKRLGIEPKATEQNSSSAIDYINQGMEGYRKYLSESAHERQIIAEAEKDADKPKWWQFKKLEEQGYNWWDGIADSFGSGYEKDENGNYKFTGLEKYQNAATANKLRHERPNNTWSQQELAEFGHKYVSNPEDAYSYAKQINDQYARWEREKQSEPFAEFAEKHPVIASAGSIPLKVAGGLGDLTRNALQYLSTGKIYEKDKAGLSDYGSAIQNRTAENLNAKGTINENVPIFGGKGLGDLYGLGMSLAQTAALAPTGSVGTLVAYFGTSASEAMSDALARGATSDQAFAFGLISGAAESIPEMIRMDSILGIKSKEGVKNLLTTIMKQAGEEAGEELTTSIINEVADRWIMQGNSQFEMNVNALVSSGYSLESARKIAWKKTIEGFAYDALTGAVSGGIMGAGAVGVNNLSNRLDVTANTKAKEMLTPEQSNLIAEGKKYESIKKRAEALEKKLAEGKDLTGYELRMFSNQVSEAARTADVDTTRKAIVEKMKSEGLSDSQAKILGEIALNKAIGNEISQVQEVMLRRNEGAMKVYNQISEKVMDSGYGDSQWAEETAIRRLRAEKKAETSATDTAIHNGIERLKADLKAKYGKDTRQYKINMESIEGKFGEIENKIYYKPRENSKLHVDEISSSLTQDDIIELAAIEKIANELGVDVHVYETKLNKNTGAREYTDKNGKKYSDNGFYDPNDNSIHIDLRAGQNGEGTMLYTASHEVVHFIKENAREHYDALEKLVTKALEDSGQSIEKLLEIQRQSLIANGKKVTDADFEEVAREEMIAEACQSFLASKTAVAEIRALKTENKGLWSALKKFFTSWFNKINKIYKTVPPDSVEAKYIADMRKALKPIRDAFMEGAVAASKNAAEQTKKTVGETVNRKKYKIRYPSFSESDISSNMETLADMDAVVVIDASKLEKTGKAPKDIFNEFFNALGNNISSEIFGDIALSKSSAKSEIRHGITAEKIASIEAIPAVIEKGKVVFSNTKKGSDVERIVVAAPIKIGKIDYYMGVMLQRDTQSQRLYLHNVVAVKAKETMSSSQDNSLTNWSDEDNSRLFISSILQKAINVKVQKQKTAKKPAETKVIHGFTLNKNAIVNEDLLEELQIYDPDAEVSTDGRITVYHRTSKESADTIRKTGIMRAKEDALFFSSKSEGYASDYGDTVLTFKIPSMQLRINDIFEGEVHFDMPIKRSANGWSANVKTFLVEEDSRLPLSERFNEQNKDIRYKVRNIVGNSGKNYGKGVYLDSNLLSNLSDTERVEMVKEYIKELGGSVFTAYDSNNNKVDVHLVESHKKFRNEKGKRVYVNQHLTDYLKNPTKQEAIALIDELIITANYTSSEPARHKHGWLDNNGKNDWDIWTTYLQDKENTVWKANLQIANSENGEKILYEVHPIEKVEEVGKPDTTTTISSISQSSEKVNRKILHKSRTYSSGQVAQMKANLSHQKVYTKSIAMKLVNALAPNIRNRSFEALSNQLWEGLNTFTALEDKRTFAANMAEMFIDRMMVDTLVKNDEWDEAVEKIAYIKHGINSIKFRPEDLPDLEHILDKKGLASLRARWGYKSSSKGGIQRRPYGLDEFITDLSREVPGMSYLADMHPTEAMVEVDKLYRNLTETVKEKYKSAFEDAPEEQISAWKSTIESKIMEIYDYYGRMSKIVRTASDTSEAVDVYLGTVPEGTEKPDKYFVDILKQMDERISFWKAEKIKTNTISHWNGILATKALQIRELKKGTFYNATQHESDIFKDSIEQLSKIEWRGTIYTKPVREVFASLKQWYTLDNPMLYDRNDTEKDSLYSDAIAMYIDILAADAETKRPLAPEEYPMIYEVMNHLYVMMRNYNKIFRNGRWEDAPDLAKNYLNILKQNTAKRSALTRAQDIYNKNFLEPMAIAKQADNYNPNGFFTQTVEDLRRSAINASIGEMNLRKKYDEFIDRNKNYLMNAAKDTVKYRGVDIPKLHLIGLYMTMKRKHARAGLALNGFEFTVKNKWWDSADRVYVPGYLVGVENPTTEMIDTATFAQMQNIESLLSDTDKQYIKVLESLFNEDLKKLKVERDMERQGYTNATLDYYYPIMRGAIAENIDTAKISDQNRATNASFNKNTVKGSRQRLVIISADAMVNRHITDMCKYYYMSQAIENYNVIYNCDISENPNNPLNIATAVKDTKVWEKDFEYFRKLIKDMQGIRDPRNAFEKAIESLRGSYAKFALGLNVKVLATQFSSMIAAGNVLSVSSLTSPKLFKISARDVDKYCPLAAVRSYEKTALRAMALTDKIGKVSEAFSIGISKMDSLVIRRLFAACQLEAEKRGSGAVGTEENKTAAGKLLEKVILETQQNSYATERSQAMRTNNELLKSLTMFTADGMKVISRIHEAAGELSVAKQNGNKTEIARAKKKLTKSIAAATCISVYLTGIAWVFNWLYDRDDDEDENKLLTFTLDTVGNFIGALPFISDLYDYIVNGFEVESVTFDTLNNLLISVGNIHKDVTSLISGNGDRTAEDITRDLRTLVYGVGQLTGIPVRNLYNLTRGIVGKFSSTAGYKIDSKFYKTSLASDLEDAIEAGDMSKASYIMSLIYDDRVGASVSEKQRREIIRLTKKEYSVLPKTVPDEIKRNGKTYTLTDVQKDTIIEEYSKVTAALDKLISSTFYAARSDKDKEYLIDYYHDKYFEIAVNKALKIADVKDYLYKAVGFSTYAKLDFVTKGIESDKDKNGNTISGSKKKKVVEAVKKATSNEEKALLYIASKGYALTDAEKQKLCKYLNSLKIPASSMKKLAEMCGLNYKNGKITP